MLSRRVHLLLIYILYDYDCMMQHCPPCIVECIVLQAVAVFAVKSVCCFQLLYPVILCSLLFCANQCSLAFSR